MRKYLCFICMLFYIFTSIYAVMIILIDMRILPNWLSEFAMDDSLLIGYICVQLQWRSMPERLQLAVISGAIIGVVEGAAVYFMASAFLPVKVVIIAPALVLGGVGSITGLFSYALLKNVNSRAITLTFMQLTAILSGGWTSSTSVMGLHGENGREIFKNFVLESIKYPANIINHYKWLYIVGLLSGYFLYFLVTAVVTMIMSSELNQLDVKRFDLPDNTE